MFKRKVATLRVESLTCVITQSGTMTVEMDCTGHQAQILSEGWAHQEYSALAFAHVYVRRLPPKDHLSGFTGHFRAAKQPGRMAGAFQVILRYTVQEYRDQRLVRETDLAILPAFAAHELLLIELDEQIRTLSAFHRGAPHHEAGLQLAQLLQARAQILYKIAYNAIVGLVAFEAQLENDRADRVEATAATRAELAAGLYSRTTQEIMADAQIRLAQMPQLRPRER
jgi:hypothetical protein